MVRDGKWIGGLFRRNAIAKANKQLYFREPVLETADADAVDDGLVGQQIFAGETTRLAYGTDEAAEGRDAFLEKRRPDWSAFPYYY